ncbi:MAG TPA: response regulator [Gemmatimonadaceae bacterium]|nr:response regulator [Gemmatimonadaceae bacterium]
MTARGRLLVVDDDRGMVRTLCDVLRFSGWEPVGAYSGEEAMQQVEASPFTAVVMDVRMTGMSGVEALCAMRERRPTLPVILMTAYASDELLQRAKDSGATRILHKPVPLPGLLEQLEVLQGSQRAVLVVDDDPDFRRPLATLLTERGYTVHEARTLDEAVAQLTAHAPPLVLLDLKLADVEPAEVVAGVQRASATTAIILCSGYHGLLHEMAASATTPRIVGALPKPFAIDQLTGMLDALLD